MQSSNWRQKDIYTEFSFKAFRNEIRFHTNPWLSLEQPGHNYTNLGNLGDEGKIFKLGKAFLSFTSSFTPFRS